MADSGAKYCAVANKFGLNDEYQKDVLNPLLKKEMCVCVSELALERVCAIRGSVRLWKGKLHCARPFCPSLSKKSCTWISMEYPPSC